MKTNTLIYVSIPIKAFPDVDQKTNRYLQIVFNSRYTRT